MDKKEIEKVFNDGSNALYETINPDTGNINDKEKYERLKKESIDNFIALSQPKEGVRENRTDLDLNKIHYQLVWLKKEYVNNVNDCDDITEVLQDLILMTDLKQLKK